MNQEESAKEEMIKWLSSPNELGREPAKIETSSKFNYSGMNYYIFKFKKNINDNMWMLAVCGGYEDDSLEHCGHVFSDFKEYNQKTEKEDAIEIVEWIKEYWKKRAKDFI